MKNIRMKVREGCRDTWWDYGIYENKKRLFNSPPRQNNRGSIWRSKAYAIRAAKAMANRVGIKFDPEIIKKHGC